MPISDEERWRRLEVAMMSVLNAHVERVEQAITAGFSRLTGQLTRLRQGQRFIMSDLTTLQAAVQRDTEIDTSAVTLINGLAQQIRDAANDPAALQALADQLDENADALSAAVAANTPAAPVEPDPNAPVDPTP